MGIWNDDQRELGATHVGDVVAEAGRQWRFRDYFPLLVDGAVVTVRITLLSMLLAVLLGVPIALARLYGAWPLRWLATAYVELFRGIPVLLLLYFLYYGLPVVAEHAHLPLALKLSPFEAAIVGFTLNYGAYEAEVHRAGIASIPSGPAWEAASSVLLGMGRWLTSGASSAPQAIRVRVPHDERPHRPLQGHEHRQHHRGGRAVEGYRILSKSSMKYLEIGVVTACLYLVMSVPLGLGSRAGWSGGGGAEAMSQPLIELRAVRKQYGAHVVLDGIDLDVADGETLLADRAERRRQSPRCSAASTGWRAF